MQGAKDAQDKYADNNLKYNECYQYAVVRNILNKRQKEIEILVNYEPKLHYFTECIREYSQQVVILQQIYIQWDNISKMGKDIFLKQ